MEVPFVNLKKQYQKIQSELSPLIEQIFADASFVNGPAVKDFEKEFARFVGIDHAIACSSGTSALYLILRVLDIKKGDEVLVPVNTFIATAEAVSLAGAKPVFVDILKDTHLIDCEKAREKISKRTKAVIPVHLFGQISDMDEIAELATEFQLKIIEDSCQAHGSEYKGKPAGTFGIAAAFSFYPSKNLGTCGDGGAVVTNDKELAGKIRMLLDHGSVNKYYHEHIGFNFRLSSIQAAVLLVKLRNLHQYSEARRKTAGLYRQYLAHNPNIILPKETVGNYHVYHLFVIRAKDRENLQKFLSENKIGSGVHYPIPLHLQKAYEFLGGKEGDFPIAEKAAKEILSLPMFPELTEAEVRYTCETINSFYGIK